MNDIQFSKTFSFRLLSGRAERHTDNSMGIPNHFVARMRKGRAHIQALSGEDFWLSEGDVFYLPKGLRYHSYWFPEEEHGTVEWESYGFELFPTPTEDGYAAQVLSADTVARSYLDTLLQDLTVSPGTVGTLYLFLERVLPHMSRRNPDPGAALMEQARAYITAHPDFKVSELARHCQISQSGLFAWMRQYGHTTPIELKKSIQTEKAIRLLDSTDLSVEEISASLGFCSSAYFRKVVKEQTGKTPRQIRKESRSI